MVGDEKVNDVPTHLVQRLGSGVDDHPILTKEATTGNHAGPTFYLHQAQAATT